jgi:hypothetical protein
MRFHFHSTPVMSIAPEREFIHCSSGHDRGEKPEFTSLLRSDTPDCLQSI